MSDASGWKPKKFTPEQEALYAKTYGSLWRADERNPRRQVALPAAAGGVAAGPKLSLRILRGKLLNTRAWSDDVIPHQVECGTVQLSELSKHRVRELVAETKAEWPAQSSALASAVALLAVDWAGATPVERRFRIDTLLTLVDVWEAQL
ncbi:MAG: hypothetical protein [Microviridae sp.]|nr:MAG: hypothetical protein [Microviridae sp.]